MYHYTSGRNDSEALSVTKRYLPITFPGGEIAEIPCRSEDHGRVLTADYVSKYLNDNSILDRLRKVEVVRSVIDETELEILRMQQGLQLQYVARDSEEEGGIVQMKGGGQGAEI